MSGCFATTSFHLALIFFDLLTLISLLTVLLPLPTFTLLINVCARLIH